MVQSPPPMAEMAVVNPAVTLAVSSGAAEMIELPWPSPYLSPNGRKHWAAKARAFKAYKAQCMWAMLAHKKALAGKSEFTITFCPPDRHRRDRDNMIAAFKAGQDAIAAVTGVDDGKFVVTYAVGNPVTGGCVLVEITEAAEMAA
jgi:crossover junction endodeoxyribonuclease RusA